MNIYSKRTGPLIRVCLRMGTLENTVCGKSYELIIYEDVQTQECSIDWKGNGIGKVGEHFWKCMLSWLPLFILCNITQLLRSFI